MHVAGIGLHSARSSAFVGKELAQFAGLIRFMNDIAAADKLALHVKLRIVGQFVNSLMPSRISESCSTSMPLNFTIRVKLVPLRPEAALREDRRALHEELHRPDHFFLDTLENWIVTHIKFLLFKIAQMRLAVFRRGSLQCRCVQFVAHTSLKCSIHHLMLLHPCLSFKGA